MRKKLTSSYSFYFNFLCTLIICIGLSVSFKEMNKDNWPFITAIIIIVILMLYSLIYFRKTSFDDYNIYISGWFTNKTIAIKNIQRIEASPFLIKPPMQFGGGYATYKVKYLNDEGQIRKFHFCLDTAWLNNWKLFKNKLLFDTKDI